MPQSKRKAPKKPYPTFPLTPHPNGQWCKTIRYRLRYFGPWDDPDGALKRYQEAANDLHAGREPKVNLTRDGFSIKDACNAFLDFKAGELRRGAIRPRTFKDYERDLDAFATKIGTERIVSDLLPLDFQQYRHHLSQTQGPVSLTNTITSIKMMFKFAYESGLVDRPVKFGPGFKTPSRREKRAAKALRERESGKKMFDASAIRKMLAHCDLTESADFKYLNKPTMKACILLALNSGFTNVDCAELPASEVKLREGIIDLVRPKTKMQRFVTLWPETVAALEIAMDSRPKASDEKYRDGAIFTLRGDPVAKEYVTQDDDGDLKNVSRTDFLSKDFNGLLKRLGLYRRGIGFSALRPTFRTWADEMKDDDACKLIMGHEIPGMDGIYIQQIGRDRIEAVTNHVRKKLFT